jgi:uncharacterized protein (TIGR03118 family)
MIRKCNIKFSLYAGVFMSSLMKSLLVATSFSLLVFSAQAEVKVEGNRYVEERLVANKSSYDANAVDEKLINAWGIAIRPAGKGGHFWVTGKDISFEYVGDVKNSPDEKLRTLHTDALSHITLPVGGDDKFATGVVFSDSKRNFVITQEVIDSRPIKAPAKFLFASDGGIISAWTERKLGDGKFQRPTEAVAVIDESASGAQFFGLAISHDYDTLYAADFGANPAIRVYDGKFKPKTMKFDAPFDKNKNGKVDAGEYAPFNVQQLTTPTGNQRIFVAYAKTQACPAEEIEKGTCKEGEIFAGEEDTSSPGYGRFAEFTEEGKLVKVWQDGSVLSAPWGFAFAPKEFGALAGTLLVSNFGSGKIAAYDFKTQSFIDFVRDENGKPIIVDKVWGLLFGNGESLGDKNALYYAAGPDDEKDGLFGSIRPAK